MAIEDELSRAEKALKDRLINAGKVAKDITNKAFKELVNTIEDYGRSLDQITDDLEKQLNLYSEIKFQAKGFGEALKQQLPYIKENKDLSQKLVGIYKEENKLLDKLVRYQEDLITGELDYNQAAKAVAESKNLQFAIDQRIRDIENEIELTQKEITKANEEDKDNLEAKLLALQEINSQLNGTKTSTTDIADNFQDMANQAGQVEALTGTIFSGLKNTSIGKLIDFDSVNKAMKATKAGGSSTFAVLGTGAKAFGASLKAALGPIGLILIAAEAIQKAFELFVEASFAADKRVTDIAKNLSIGKEGARGIYDNLTDLKGTLDTEFATTENIVKAFGEIANLTEFVTSATKDQVETQIVLTNQLGQSVDEALALQGIFAVNNVEADEGLDIVYDQIAAFANQNKLIADGRQILKQVQGVSKQVLLNFRGNTGELVKTVLQANKLGLSLDQVNKIAGSLLDFEQSIEAELSAELITGKQLNLDKARQFALTNDIAGLTQEINNQGVTAAEFAKMNRIEQEAIAGAFGMQASEMADMLFKQELIRDTGGETLKNLKEEVKLLETKGKRSEALFLQQQIAQIEQGILQGKTVQEAQKSVDAQTKFNLALERAKEIFTDVVDGGLLDGLVDALNGIVRNLEALGFTSGVKSLDQQEAQAKKIQEQKSNTLSPERIAELQDIANREMGLFGFTNDWSPVSNDRVEEARKILAQAESGRTVNADDFTIRTHPKDELVIAGGTNLSGGSNQEMIGLLQKLVSATEQSRQVTVSVDGENVFSAMGRVPMK
jgi:hypothetical protein